MSAFTRSRQELAQDRQCGATAFSPIITPFVEATAATPFLSTTEGRAAMPRTLSPALVASLSAAYGVAVTAEEAFDAILCLLSAASYTLRFAEDLEDVFPHVPFPPGHEALQDAVRIGREIRVVA